MIKLFRYKTSTIVCHMVEVIVYGGEGEVTVAEVKVRTGSLLSQGKVVLLYKIGGPEPVQVGKVKSSAMGRVVEVMVSKGDTIKPGQEVVKFTGGCQHPTIMKDMCAGMQEVEEGRVLYPCFQSVVQT